MVTFIDFLFDRLASTMFLGGLDKLSSLGPPLIKTGLKLASIPEKLYHSGMIFKSSIFAIALWTLLLAPLFCGLGMVVHSCLDENAVECHHELECDTDPCQILILAQSQRNEEYSNSDFSPEPFELPLLDDVVRTSHLVEISPSSDTLFELIEISRTLPLLC